MEKMFMSASIVVAIVLCVVGIVKLPFKSLKARHPQVFKTICTILSILLSIGLSILDQIYIIEGCLFSFEFATLLITVLAGVFVTYNGVYEGFGIKELKNIIKENISKAKELAKDKKVIDFLNKVTDIDKAIALLEERKNKENSEV